MAYRGYHFFIDGLELPYAPSKLKVTIGSKNQTVELIDGSEINLLKNPKLTEIEFEIGLPRGRQYAFANTLVSTKTYTDCFEKLMLEKKPTELVITRPNPFLNGSTGIGGTVEDFESTTLTVSLEGYTMEEDAGNAYDVKVSLKFKEYVTYGTVKTTVVTTNDKDPSEPVEPVVVTPKPADEPKTHVVQSGDTLWDISRKYYGTGSYWETIFNANKKVIDDTARKYGRKDSSNGHWIYPGTKLIIPALNK